jgi:hypothetical protein
MNDTGGKFATGVNDTGGTPSASNISVNFRKIRNGPNGIKSGAWEKLIHVENLKSKISWHCPFKLHLKIYTEA